MTSERRWHHTLARYQEAVEGFVALVDQVPEAKWHVEPAPGKWSAAVLTLHVTDAYAMGRRALAGGTSMRLRIPPWRAWILRKTLLPGLLRRGEFPRVRAPREIQPDLDIAARLTRSDATSVLRSLAAETATAFRTADRTPGTPYLTHAYFGALDHHLAVRFLTAHTQHHTKGLRGMLQASQRIGASVCGSSAFLI